MEIFSRLKFITNVGDFEKNVSINIENGILEKSSWGVWGE